MMRWILILVASLLAVSAFADSKYGKQVRFAGIHPIPKSEGGGMCYIEGPHVHIYAANKVEFRDHGPDHVFVGDPVAYGFDGPKFTYNGPHPIHVEPVVGGPPAVEYCYITGPHFHNFAPPEGPDFKLQGNAYFYVAEPPRAFIDARPMYIGINDYYRPLVYDRPRIEVEAPTGWIGARAEFAGPGVVIEGRGPGVVVEGPRGRVEGVVEGPRGRVEGVVEGPRGHVEGVVVAGPHGRVVEPGIRADVHAPPPPNVHVGVGVNVRGPGVVVHEQPHPAPVVVHKVH